MDIRPYRDEDAAAVIALWEACGLTRPWNPPAGDIALPRSSGHGEILLAEEDGAEDKLIQSLTGEAVSRSGAMPRR